MTTTLIEQEQAETTRLMVMVERLQQAGHDERGIAAAVDHATGRARPRSSRRALRLRLRGAAGTGATRPESPARRQHARPWI